MPTFALTVSVSEALNEPPSTKSFFGIVPVSASVSSGVTLYISPHVAAANLSADVTPSMSEPTE